jgi:hypothetical protein
MQLKELFYVNCKQQQLDWIIVPKIYEKRIKWNVTLKAKYENLIFFAEMARVQCINTTTCERTFSMQK